MDSILLVLRETFGGPNSREQFGAVPGIAFGPDFSAPGFTAREASRKGGDSLGEGFLYGHWITGCTWPDGAVLAGQVHPLKNKQAHSAGTLSETAAS